MDPQALRELFEILRQRSKGALVVAAFPGADLRGSHLLRADLVGADLSAAQLDHSTLEGAQLGAARLVEASLRGVSLNGADLTDADLRGADLSGARVEGACLAGADLRGARCERILGQPASLAGTTIDSKMCERSGLSDAGIIAWWRDGARLADIEAFSDTVRRACLEMPDAVDERQPDSRRVLDAELSARRQRLHRSKSIPPSARRVADWVQLSQPPPAIIEAAELPGSLVLQLPPVDLTQLEEDEEAPPSLSHPTPRAYREGETLLGARLVEQLGSGQSGVVWRAELGDGTVVAVKYFDRTRATLGLAAPAFRRSVRLLSRVMLADAKVAVPKLYCVARNELTVVMEYFPNGTVAGVPALGWGTAELVKFFEQLCREVAALHDLGMVHRSIKPNNILIDAELGPVLADPDGVDLEEAGKEGPSDYRLYSAPEELTGMGTQSPTADVYSLGRILHFLLLGTDPSLQAHDIAPLDSLTKAPEGLVRIIRKATARDAVLRYQWVSELIADLQHYEQPAAVGLARQGPAPGEFFLGLSSLPPGAPSMPPAAPTAKAAGAPAAPKPAARQAASSPSRLQRRLGFAGAYGLAACLVYLLVEAAPTPAAASALGIALTLSLALLTLLYPALGARPRLFSAALAGLVAALLLQVEPDRIVLVRWKYTLGHGHPGLRAQVARHLAAYASRDMDGVDLSLANLSRADLSRVSFRNANLSKADFTDASLQDADLEGANVSEANLAEADLFGSNIARAQGWSRAHCGPSTVMPTGWDCLNGSPEPEEATAGR